MNKIHLHKKKKKRISSNGKVPVAIILIPTLLFPVRYPLTDAIYH